MQLLIAAQRNGENLDSNVDVFIDPAISRRIHIPSVFSTECTLVGACDVDNFGYMPIDSAMREVQGAVFGGNQNGQFTIVMDRFATLPTYVYESDDVVVFFTHFDEFVAYMKVQLHLDMAGFWELMLFDGGINGRTLFQEVRQLPPASVTVLDLSRWELTTSRYFNFFYPEVDVASPSQVASSIDEIMAAALSKIPSGKKILLPLSGGVDSRVLALMLARHGDPSQISAVTFADHPRSYECLYAKRICALLGIPEHYFHRLQASSYSDAISDFATLELGRLSIAHCHLYDYLVHSKQSTAEYSLVSGIFSDAASGYSAYPETSAEKEVDRTSLYQRLGMWHKVLDLPASCMADIQEDIGAIYDQWISETSLPTFAEYVYVSQRQQSLLFPLANLYMREMPVYLPFLHPELVDLLFGLPYEFRYRKNILHVLLAQFGGDKMTRIGNVSSSYGSSQPSPVVDVNNAAIEYGESRLRENLRMIDFKTRNYLDVGSSWLSRDSIHLHNPYQTESHGYVLRSQLPALIEQSARELVELNILSQTTASRLSQKRYRSQWFGPQFRLVTLGRTIHDMHSSGSLIL